MSGRVGHVPAVAEHVPPPHSLEAEEAVLGTIVLSGRILGALAGDEGLRPEHFYRERNALIYRGMLALHDRGVLPDVVTVADELRDQGTLSQVGGTTAIDALAGPVPLAGNARAYAQDVMRLATWRQRLAAAYDMQAAVGTFDEDAFQAAEARLAEPAGGRQRAFDRVELGMAVSKLLEGGGAETFPWPFARLNDLTRGGMRRGQVTLITGPTRHGKSVMLDMALESAGDAGAKVGLFANEMAADERALRVVARRGYISYERLELAAAGLWQLLPVEVERSMNVMNAMPFEIVECAGWTANEVCREARRRKFDVVGFDIIQRLPHRAENRVRELEQASNDFDRLSKETGAHVLIAAHLNRGRQGISPVVPFPSMGDIRDCAQLANDADNVLMVWQEQDTDTGDPLGESIIRFSKVRAGKPGGLSADFIGDQQRFELSLLDQDESDARVGAIAA